MNFIRYQPLKEQLRKRSLNDRQALPYFVLFCVLSGPVPVSGPWSVPVPNFLSTEPFGWVCAGLWILITVSGLIHVYQCNGGRTGFDFIKKFIVLGWVALVRWTLMFMPLSAGLVFTILFLHDRVDESSQSLLSFWVALFGPALFLAVLFQRIGRHIKDTLATAE